MQRAPPRARPDGVGRTLARGGGARGRRRPRARRADRRPVRRGTRTGDPRRPGCRGGAPLRRARRPDRRPRPRDGGGRAGAVREPRPHAAEVRPRDADERRPRRARGGAHRAAGLPSLRHRPRRPVLVPLQRRSPRRRDRARPRQRAAPLRVRARRVGIDAGVRRPPHAERRAAHLGARSPRARAQPLRLPPGSGGRRRRGAGRPPAHRERGDLRPAHLADDAADAEPVGTAAARGLPRARDAVPALGAAPARSRSARARRARHRRRRTRRARSPGRGASSTPGSPRRRRARSRAGRRTSPARRSG